MSSIEQPILPQLENADVTQAGEQIDFTMITFSLGGRDYGINIMDVKEISKVASFTYVPNTARYVRGVHNLRGEIISIIDFRTMFNLEVAERFPGDPEDVLFLRSAENVVGAVVDVVNDVVGVSSSHIQPPHPLFGDINARYIKGVVEHEGNLYIILDSEVVFGEEFQTELDSEPDEPEAISDAPQPVQNEGTNLDYTFVQEALETLGGFYTTEMNSEWVDGRFKTWEAERRAQNESPQMTTAEEAKSFLSSFYSSNSGDYWSGLYWKGAIELLPQIEGANVRAWVIATGKGHDAYSLACMMRSRYQEAAITIWAHDSDLLSISSAPSLTADPEIYPELSDFLVEGSRGQVFSEEIQNIVQFEYHDVRNENNVPNVQVIVVRDFLSFLSEASRSKLLGEMYDALSESGIVICGDREILPRDRWEPIESSKVRAFRKAQV